MFTNYKLHRYWEPLTSPVNNIEPKIVWVRMSQVSWTSNYPLPELVFPIWDWSPTVICACSAITEPGLRSIGTITWKGTSNSSITGFEWIWGTRNVRYNFEMCRNHMKPVFCHLLLSALAFLSPSKKFQTEVVERGRGPNHVLQDSEDLLSRLGYRSAGKRHSFNCMYIASVMCSVSIINSQKM